MNLFESTMFFTNLLAYGVLAGIMPSLFFAVMLATNNRPPVLVPADFDRL
jgi:hypothetical protein